MYCSLSAPQQTVCESETFYRTLCGHWGKIRVADSQLFSTSTTAYSYSRIYYYWPYIYIYIKKNMYNIPHKTQENIQGVVARNCLSWCHLASHSYKLYSSTGLYCAAESPTHPRLDFLISFSIYEASASSWLFERLTHRRLQERALTCLWSFVSERKVGAAIQAKFCVMLTCWDWEGVSGGPINWLTDTTIPRANSYRG